MPFEPQDNSGSLFVNDQKQSANQPDRKGSIRVAGVDYWVSGWLKKTQQGQSWLSLSVTPKDQKQKPARQQRRQDDDDHSDIPF